jgi:hypothetical protein
MAVYDFFLVCFVATNFCLFFWQHAQNVKGQDSMGKSNEAVIAATAAKWQFKKRFLPVYLLVFGADWLQVCLSRVRGGLIPDCRAGAIHIYSLQR